MARAVTAPLRPRCATRGTAQRARTERAVALCLALGLDDRLIALLRQRLDEADLVEGDLVVRAVAGSSDARAVADCRLVAAGLAAASGRVIGVGFLFAAGPPLDAGTSARCERARGPSVLDRPPRRHDTATMSTDAAQRRLTSAGRRLGYAAAIVINALLLYAINVWPGWHAVPFLDGEAREVVDLVDVSLIAGMITNGVCVLVDRPAVKMLGDLVTLAIGLAVLVVFWQVFPFDFNDSAFDWTLLIRIVLGLAVLGTAIGLVLQVVVVFRSRVGTGGPTRPSSGT